MSLDAEAVSNPQSFKCYLASPSSTVLTKTCISRKLPLLLPPSPYFNPSLKLHSLRALKLTKFLSQKGKTLLSFNSLCMNHALALTYFAHSKPATGHSFIFLECRVFVVWPNRKVTSRFLQCANVHQ